MSISIKIFLVDLDSVKTSQYPTDMYIIDVCKDIRSKFNYGEGGLDHGLLFKSQGLWLAPNKMLGHYDLKFGDVLEFRKKHRILKVKTLDGNAKNILVDESTNVKSITEVIGQRIGLANTEEYSLMRDEKEVDPKLSEKEKKKNGDEAVGVARPTWLNPDKTLREQGLTEDDFVVLKKKFFVTDQNVDRTDPVQLVIMHAQAYKDILTGKLPCTAEEAAQFGGITMQIMYGNQDPTKHKPGYAKMKDLVPPEYVKIKEVEKLVYREHSILQGTTELNAKFRYVQLIRSLKSYGTTFFLVTEPADKAKKKKATQILLGITKASVIRMNVETKQIISDWRLTQLRNWSSSPKTFTLDLGDHDTKYYQVETKEGEEITRLLSGYVEILVKKRNQLNIRPKEVNMEEQAVIEEYVKPGQSKNVAAVTNTSLATQAKSIHSVVAVGSPEASAPAVPKPVKGVIAQDLDEVEDQELLLKLIKLGIDGIESNLRDLNTPLTLPTGTDPAAIKWRLENAAINSEFLCTHVGGLLASISSILLHANGDTKEMDYDLLGASLNSLIFSCSHTTQALRILSGLTASEEDQEELVNCGKELVEGTLLLLNELRPIVTGHRTLAELHNAASKVANSGTSLLIMTDRIDISELNQSELVAAAGDVGNSIGNLVAATKQSLSSFKNPNTQKKITNVVKSAEECSAVMATITSIMASVISNPLARDQLIETAVHTREIIMQLQTYCGESSDSEFIQEIANIVDETEEALSQLVDKARNVESTPESEIQYLNQRIDEVGSVLAENIDSPQELFSSAKEIAIVGTQLAESLREKANTAESKEESLKLENTAKGIADLMAKMVGLTRESLTNPENEETKIRLLETIDEMSVFIATNCSSFTKITLIQEIVKAFRATIACANQLIAYTRQSNVGNRDRAKLARCTKAGKSVVDLIPDASRVINEAIFDPSNFLARYKVYESALGFVPHAEELLSSVQDFLNTVNDTILKATVTVAHQRLDYELQNLKGILDVADAPLKELDLNSFAQSIQQEVQAPAENGESLSIEKAELLLTAQSKLIQDSLRKISAAAKEEKMELVIKSVSNTVSEFQTLKETIQIISEQDAQLKEDLIKSSEQIANLLVVFMENVSNPTENKVKPNANAAIQSLNDMIQQLPRQKTMSEAMGTIRELTDQLNASQSAKAASPISPLQPPVSETETVELQKVLLNAASELSAATQNLVSGTKSDAVVLKTQVREVEKCYEKLIEAATVIRSTNESDLSSAVYNIGLETDFFLNALQSSLSDKEGSGLNDVVVNAAKSVGDTVTNLLDIFESSSNGIDSSTKANQILNGASRSVAEINFPKKHNITYGDCQFIIQAHAFDLEDKLARFTDLENTLKAAKLVEACTSIQNLVAIAAHGSHILAIADSETIPAVPSKIEKETLEECASSFEVLFGRIFLKSTPQLAIFEDLGTLNSNLATLCQLARKSLQMVDIDEENRAILLNIGQSLSETGSKIIPALKTYAITRSESNKAKITPFISEIQKKVEMFKEIAENPKFSGSTARPGPKAVLIQQIIIDNCNRLIQEGRVLVSSTKQVLANSDDESKEILSSSISLLIQSSKDTVDCILNQSPAEKIFQAVEQTLISSGNEIEISIEKVENGTALSDTSESAFAFNRTIESVLETIDGLSTVEQSNIQGTLSNLQELTERFQLVTKSAPGVAATLNLESQAPLLNSVKHLSVQLNKFVGSIQSQVIDPNDVRNFQIQTEASNIHSIVCDLSKSVKDAEKVDPIFSEATKTIEVFVSEFDQLVKDKADEKVPLGETSKTLASSEKVLLDLLASAISEKNPEEYGRIASNTSDLVLQINTQVANMIHQTEDSALVENMNSIAKDLGETAIMMVNALKQGTKTTEKLEESQTKISQGIKDLNSKFKALDSIVEEVAGGIVACQQVSEQVTDVVAELETSLAFAAAGQLNPISEGDNFSTHKDGLLQSAQQLTEIFKTFVNANSLSQETLGTLVSGSAEAMKELKTKSIMAATALSSTDYNTQQELLKTTMDIGDAMKSLIDATMIASGAAEGGEHVTQLNTLIEHQFDVVSKMVDVVKTLDDATSRIIEAFQNTNDALYLSIGELGSDSPALGTALPSELTEFANKLSTSMASLVALSTYSQDDTFLCLNLIKNDVENLCRAGKATSANAPDEIKVLTIDTVKSVILECTALIQEIKRSLENNTRPQLQSHATKIKAAVGKLVDVAGKLVPEGYVDPNNPNVIAERELLSAANAIEAAARKLALLKPAETPRQANEELNFEDQILEAAKGIAAASSALVRSATGVQREIVAKGKVSEMGESGMYFSDGTWNDGLVSAAKLVMGATNDLCESANQFVKGTGQIERVIVNAKNVSSSTVQLLTAALVRSDPNSQVQIRLRAAGKAVTQATEQLVSASQSSAPKMNASTAEEGNAAQPLSSHKAKILEMEIQMKILKLEKELEVSRKQLADLRKQKYTEGASNVVVSSVPWSPGKKVPNPNVSNIDISTKMSRMRGKSIRHGPSVIGVPLPSKNSEEIFARKRNTILKKDGQSPTRVRGTSLSQARSLKTASPVSATSTLTASSPVKATSPTTGKPASTSREEINRPAKITFNQTPVMARAAAVFSNPNANNSSSIESRTPRSAVEKTESVVPPRPAPSFAEKKIV